jgi:hypothetical protein
MIGDMMMIAGIDVMTITAVNAFAARACIRNDAAKKAWATAAAIGAFADS